ncbi:MAG: group III truncated hemoglobin [Defluviimonas sp.]|nr:group III truncated hemoglobin [Defluviimonas sp.]
MTSLPPRFAITAGQIDRVVAAFYAAIRQDAQLGPIFAAHVTDWPAHEAKVAAFWRNAILLDGGYAGSPMRAHIRAGDVKPAHFPDWLAIFDATLQRELPAETAAAWSALAHRIGQGLRFGLAEMETRAGGVPLLR